MPKKNTMKPMQFLKQLWAICVLFVSLIVVPSAAASDAASKEVWTKLNAEEIAQALESRSLAYSSTIFQTFEASGRTLYDTGTPSWGYWRVQGDQYCSQWPPLNSWGCYDLYRSGDGLSLKFQSGKSNVSVGKYNDLN